MNRRAYVASGLFVLLVFVLSATVGAAPLFELTPGSGSPGDSVHIEGSDFAGSKSVGIGIGAEVQVVNEVVAVTGSGNGPFEGFTLHPLIKPGSFRWTFNVGAVEILVYD